MKHIDTGASGSPLWGGALGAVLLAWSVMIVLTPEIGSVVAVFGSPLLFWFIIVRLVGGGSATGRPAAAKTPGATISELRSDPDLLARVSARSDGFCAACGAPGPLRLRPILPVGRASRAVDQRFEAVCDACSSRRSLPGRAPRCVRGLGLDTADGLQWH